MPSTPRRLPSGSWNCYAYLGKDAEGKLIRKSVTRATKAEARAAAVELEADAERVAAISDDLTLAEAVRKYLDSRANLHSPSTRRSNEFIYRNRLGALAHIPVSRITSPMMQDHINAQRASGIFTGYCHLPSTLSPQKSASPSSSPPKRPRRSSSRRWRRSRPSRMPRKQRGTGSSSLP